MSIDPRSGSSIPAIRRRRVVFPQPEGPKRKKSSPFSTRRETPSTAVTSPNRFVTLSRVTLTMRSLSRLPSAVCRLPFFQNHFFFLNTASMTITSVAMTPRTTK